MSSEVILPEMGEGVIEGTLSRWLVEEGDRVEAFAPIAEVETDKVTTEITTEVPGVVLKRCVEEGETVPVDTVLAYVGEPGEDVETAKAAKSQQNGRNGQKEPAEPAVTAAPAATDAAEVARRPQGYTGRISPLVGRIAAEHNVDLGQVPGTGRDGRITKNDILAYVEAREKAAPLEPAAPRPEPQPAPQPATVPAKPEPAAAEHVTAATMTAGDELVPLTGMRRTIAEHMVRSKHTSPHATTVFEFDFSAVAKHRAAHKAQFARDGARLTYTVYIVFAIVKALKQHPLANSMWTDEGILLKREINVGMAAAVPDGLLVPVIKNADQYSLLGLARAVNDLAERARNKQLKPNELQGGTFSITNHGTTGSLFATPVINQPQAGILGIGKIEKRVKVIDDAIAIRPLAYASFSFDHRILDGATADAFVSSIKETLENWQG